MQDVAARLFGEELTIDLRLEPARVGEALQQKEIGLPAPQLLEALPPHVTRDEHIVEDGAPVVVGVGGLRGARGQAIDHFIDLVKEGQLLFHVEQLKSEVHLCIRVTSELRSRHVPAGSTGYNIQTRAGR